MLKNCQFHFPLFPKYTAAVQVRRIQPVPVHYDLTEIMLRTVVVENLPPSSTIGAPLPAQKCATVLPWLFTPNPVNDGNHL